MSTYSDAVLATSGLVAYWKLDETSGTAIADASGNGHGGTAYESPTLGVASLVPEDDGTAIDFDGAIDNIQIPYHAAFASAPWSIEAWVRADGRSGQFRTVLNNTGGGNGQLLYATDSNKWQIWVWPNPGATDATKVGTANVVLGEMVHLVATYSGTTLSLYVNGELNATGTTGTWVGNNGTALILGRVAPAGGNQFDGVIDEVSYYSVALDATTIEAHYTLGTEGPPNIAPVVDAGADDATVQHALWTQAGSFTDADGVSVSWTATVDYDDGDGPEALTLDGFDFTLSHTWTTTGAKTVTVAVEDDGGLIGTDTVTVTVAEGLLTGDFVVGSVTGTHPTAPRIPGFS